MIFLRMYDKIQTKYILSNTRENERGKARLEIYKQYIN